MTDKKIPGRPFKKGKGKDRDPRINTAGAPKGETWAGTLRLIAEMDGPDIVEWAADQAKEFKKLPAGVTLKSLVCLWAYASLSRDFSPGIFNSIMDRTDGPLSDALEERLRTLEKAVEAKNEHSNAN